MLTTRLKDDNWALHQIAERQETPSTLMKGTMSREGYIHMLSQQYLVNDALDHALRGAIPTDPKLASLIAEEQYFAQYLVEDLRYFETDLQSIEPDPGTTRLIEHIEAHRDRPLYLLGLHYVRLGACNGNSFVARVVRKTYDLPDEYLGTRYYDPFGAEQRSKWYEFKDALDALPLTPEQQDEVFDATRAAYVYSINMDLIEHKDADQILREHAKTLDKKAFDEGHSVHVKPAGKGTPASAH